MRRTPPPSSPNASSMAYWWAAPHSIPKAGRNLCRPALPRYFPGRMYNFLLILLTLDALILTTAVLLQAGQGGGLAALGARGRRSRAGPRAAYAAAAPREPGAAEHTAATLQPESTAPSLTVTQPTCCSKTEPGSLAPRRCHSSPRMPR